MSQERDNKADRAAAWQTMKQLRAEWELAANPVRTSRKRTTIFPDFYDNTSLADVCIYGDLDGLKNIIAAGINPLEDKDQALLWAAQGGYTDLLPLLLDNGADIHTKNELILHVTAKNGRADTLALLLDRGADLHSGDDLALKWAADNNHIESVYLLIERGAPLENLTAEQRQAYDAYSEEHERLDQTALRLGQKLKPIFQAAIWVGHTAEMQKLWQEIPAPLQKQLDFQHFLSCAKIQTNKLYKPKVMLVK